MFSPHYPPSVSLQWKTCASIGQCTKEYMQPPVRRHLSTRTTGAIIMSTSVLIILTITHFPINHKPVASTTTTKHDKTSCSVPPWPPHHHITALSRNRCRAHAIQALPPTRAMDPNLLLLGSGVESKNVTHLQVRNAHQHPPPFQRMHFRILLPVTNWPTDQSPFEASNHPISSPDSDLRKEEDEEQIGGLVRRPASAGMWQ